MRPPGCPIRIPQALRLPAPPLGISPRGRVLPRPPSPRHPPCARLPDVFLVHCSINCSIQARPFGLAFQTGSRQPRTHPSLTPPEWTAAPSRSLPGSRRPCSNRTIVMLLIQCAWMNRHDQCRPQRHPRPQDPAGLAWRIVKVQKLGKEQERPDRDCMLVPTNRPARGGRAWTRTRDLGLIRAAL